MESNNWSSEFRDIISDTVRSLRPRRLQTANAYLDPLPYEKGAAIGPVCLRILAPQHSVLVFVDDNPSANFGHACRYRFYDARSHRFIEEVPARYPPYAGTLLQESRTARKLLPIHKGVCARKNRQRIKLPATAARLDSASKRSRYAILFAGSSERRHVNDLEYCYRMLTAHYGFAKDNVFVCNFDGTLGSSEGAAGSHWPRDEDPDEYEMKPHAKGNRAGFQQACALLRARKPRPGDLVFVHTNGHGDAIDAGEAFLLQHDRSRYLASEFCEDLATLGEYGSLLVMMQQCFSGGFVDPILQSRKDGLIRASQVGVACASTDIAFQTSDELFNRFTLGWIAAHMNADPFGNPPDAKVDTNGSGFVEAQEAFKYACLVKSPFDEPVDGYEPEDAEDMRLA